MAILGEFCFSVSAVQRSEMQVLLLTGEKSVQKPRFVSPSRLYMDLEFVIATLQGLKAQTGVRVWEKRR